MFFKNKKNYKNINSSDRDEAISRLEHERLRINLEIEKILKIYAKESGIRSLAHRKHKMGNSPNDWYED